jgi:hypothetical protein
MAAGHADAQVAAVGHGVAGVDGEVEEGVLELVRVDQGVELFGGQVELHRDALGEERASSGVMHAPGRPPRRGGARAAAGARR